MKKRLIGLMLAGMMVLGSLGNSFACEYCGQFPEGYVPEFDDPYWHDDYDDPWYNYDPQQDISDVNSNIGSENTAEEIMADGDSGEIEFTSVNGITLCIPDYLSDSYYEYEDGTGAMLYEDDYISISVSTFGPTNVKDAFYEASGVKVSKIDQMTEDVGYGNMAYSTITKGSDYVVGSIGVFAKASKAMKIGKEATGGYVITITIPVGYHMDLGTQDFIDTVVNDMMVLNTVPVG